MTFLSLYLSPHYRTGGQRRYMELLTGFVRAGHEVILFHRSDAKLPVPDGITTVKLDVPTRRFPGRDRAFALRLGVFLQLQLLQDSDVLGMLVGEKRLFPDLIFQFGESSVASLSVLRSFFSVPVFIALRSNWVEANKRLRSTGSKGIPGKLKGLVQQFRDLRRERRVAGIADHLFFQSPYDQEEFCSRQNCADGFATVIPNSTRVSWFDPQFAGRNISSQLKNILYIGSEDPRKGLDHLLQAFARLRGKGLDFTLKLLGHYSSGFEAEVQNRGLSDGVEVGGIVDSTFPELAKADLFVIPSLYDSFPNTLLEALYCGTPAIGSNVAGIAVMLENNTLLFPPGDVDAIEHVLLNLANSSEYNEAARWCRSRAKHFDFDWTQTWLTAIERALSTKAAADNE